MKIALKMINEFWTKWQLWPKNVITKIPTSKFIWFYFYSSIRSGSAASVDNGIHAPAILSKEPSENTLTTTESAGGNSSQTPSCRALGISTDFRMTPKPKQDILLFVVIIILSYENMITTNFKVSYFGFNFNRKSTYR